MTSKAIQDAVTLGLGVIGAFLGVFNTVTQWQERRVRLRVNGTVEEYGAALGVASKYLMLQVENRSTFPITIKEAGIEFKNLGVPSIEFSRTLQGKDSKGENETSTTSLPIQIEARSHILLQSGDLNTLFQAYLPRCAYIKTACGVTKKIKSKQWRRPIDDKN